MTDIRTLKHGSPEEVVAIMEKGPLTEQELRAALINALNRIQQLEAATYE